MYQHLLRVHQPVLHKQIYAPARRLLLLTPRDDWTADFLCGLMRSMRARARYLPESFTTFVRTVENVGNPSMLFSTPLFGQPILFTARVRKLSLFSKCYFGSKIVQLWTEQVCPSKIIIPMAGHCGNGSAERRKCRWSRYAVMLHTHTFMLSLVINVWELFRDFHANQTNRKLEHWLLLLCRLLRQFEWECDCSGNYTECSFAM